MPGIALALGNWNLALSSPAPVIPIKGPVYEVGFAKIDITPNYPIRLNGYFGRNVESTNAVHPLHAKAMAIGSEKQGAAVLISVDNCIVPRAVYEEVVTRLSRHGVAREKLVILVSHSHTAPKLAGAADNIFGADIPPADQAHIDRYTKEFTDYLEQAALAALKDRAPARVAWAQTSAGFGANRRTKGGPVDHDAPVLVVTDPKGNLRGLVLNYACHCTTLDGKETRMCGDWAAFAQQDLEDACPGITAMTAIGCGADQNPSPRVGMDFAKQHGKELADAVLALLNQRLKPISGKLECRMTRFALPFEKVPTREDYEKILASSPSNSPAAYHARKEIGRIERGEKLPAELPYMVQEWNFGDKLAMVFLPGEVVVDYSLRLKREFDPQRLWVSAYANYVPCYIPSKRIWNEGGYEGGGAMVYYDLPTRLSENTEEIIINAVYEIMPKSFSHHTAPEPGSGSQSEPAPISTPPRRPYSADFPPPKNPAEALKSIQTKPGLTVDLAAAEPLIVDPVAIDFGTDGTLWVVEMCDYPTGLLGNYEPGGRVKLLTSSKHDGHYDQETIFIDKIPFPTGIMQWRKGVLVCAAPDILYAEDTNGDGKADVVKKLFTGFATHNFQARVNGLRWGLDNWVYAAAGLFGGTIHSHLNGKDYELSGRDFRFNPDTGDFEPVSGLTQQSRSRDDWGNWLGCDNSTLAWHFPVEERYIRRNPFVAGPDPRVLVPADPEPNVLYPISRTLERFNHPESANRTTSACGIGFYTDDLLGPGFRNNAFVCEPVHNLVRRLVISSDGIALSGNKAGDEQQSEFFASADNWSRPVEARTGPDGALWIVDMYRFVIEHPRWIPGERLAKLDVRAGDDKGRIYRVFPAKGKLRQFRDLTKLSTSRLAMQLDSSNGTIRDLVHRELYQRGDKSAAPPLLDLALKVSSPAVRLQALCVLDGLHTLTPDMLTSALADRDPHVRSHALRLCEPILSSLSSSSAAIYSSVLSLASDPDPGVRFQLALTLGEWNDPRAGEALGKLALSDHTNRWMRTAIISSAVHQPGAILTRVLSLPETSDARADMIGKLIATAAGAKDPKILKSIVVALGAAGFAPDPEPWLLGALADLQESLQRQNTSLEKLASSNNATLQAAARRLGAVIERAGDIAATVADTAEAARARMSAMRLLAWSTNQNDIQTLVSIMTSGSGSLQKAALASLKARRDPTLPVMLLAAWPKASPGVREQILDLLFSRDDSVMQVLDAVEQNLIVPTEIPIANRQQLQKSANAKIQQRALALFPAHSGNRAEVVQRFSTVRQLVGDPEHGAQIFSAACATCHQLKGLGNAVGPDLAPLNDKSVDDFLVAILDPNAAIEPRFVQYNVQTKDDRTLAGVVQNETASSLTLVQSGGLHETILRSDIASIRASTLSLMPEGLEEGKQPQDFADLIAYLKSQPSPFGSASADKAEGARKKLLADPAYTKPSIKSAAESLPYPSWLGTLPLHHCRMTDGHSSLTWTCAAPKDFKPHAMNLFRVPVGMGFLSEFSGKFFLKVNGHSAVDFDVSLHDATWKNPASEVILQYQVMENNDQDSNGLLTISVRGEWLQPGQPVAFEVAGSASNSQRWFGIYTLEVPTQASAARR